MNDILDADCLSCQSGNESCGYANAQFSPGKGSYYILECYGPSIPYAILYSRTEKLGKWGFEMFSFIYKIDFLGLINDNLPFREWIDSRLMPYVDYFSVPLDKKNTGKRKIERKFYFLIISIVGYGMIILPPNYNPNVTIASYPVIVSM